MSNTNQPLDVSLQLMSYQNVTMYCVSDWGGESEEILYLDFLSNGIGVLEEWVLNFACHSWDSECSTTNVYSWLKLSGTSLMLHPKIQLYIS